MKYTQETCSHCNEQKKVVISSNRLSKNLCAKCITELIDIEKSSDLKLLSETLQIPFDLNEYYTVALSSTDKVEIMDTYLEHLSHLKPRNTSINFDWNRIDEHYNASLSFTIALAEIEPIRAILTKRGKQKWGEEFTFNEIVELENQYENTVKQYGITSILQQEAVKNAVRINLRMKELINSGEYGELKNATSSYSAFLKAANIDVLVESSNDETIRTVSDLVSFMEKNGFEFNRFRPDIEPDEIDILMDNYTEKVKEVVYGATGFDTQFKDLLEKLQRNVEEKDAAVAAETFLLEDDIDADDSWVDEENEIMEREMEEEELELDFDDLD